MSGWNGSALSSACSDDATHLDVIGVLVIGRQDAQRWLVAQLHHVSVDLVAHRRRGGRRILRIERHDEDAIAAAFDQSFESRGDRWVGVAHRPVDNDVIAERLERAGEFFGLRAREGLDRRLVRLTVPDFLIVVGFAQRAQRQDNAVENGLPQHRIIFDDARIAEKLFQIAAYGGRVGRIGRAEIYQKHADAVFDRGGLRPGGRFCDGWSGRRLRQGGRPGAPCFQAEQKCPRRRSCAGRRRCFDDVFGHRGGVFAVGNGRSGRGIVCGFARSGRQGRRFTHGFSLPLCAAAGPNDREERPAIPRLSTASVCRRGIAQARLFRRLLRQRDDAV